MVAKKSAPAKAARTKASLTKVVESVDPPEFVLADFRVLELRSNRFLPNEAAAKGIFQLSTEVGDVVVPSEGEAPVGTVRYTVTIEGFKRGDDGTAKDEKSFAVAVEMEGKFMVYDCPAPGKGDVERMLPPIIQQLHVLAIDKIRGAAADMGYHGVRPHLGAKNVRTEVGDGEPATD